MRESPGSGQLGTSPRLGFMPNTPHIAAGQVIEPPVSLPIAIAIMSAATAAADPPLEPPTVRVGSQGLRVSPMSGLRVSPSRPNSDVLVLPTTIAPAPRRRSTTIESSRGYEVTKGRRAVGGADAGRPLQVLDTDGNAVERAQLSPLGDRPVGIGRGRAGAVGGDRHEGLEAGVVFEAGDALERPIHDLDGRDLTSAISRAVVSADQRAAS